MEINIKLWLADIKRSIVEIYDFLPVEKDFLAIRRDLKTRKAFERNIEILGEALNRMLRVNPDIIITNSRRFLNSRNRILHGYDTVSEDIIWAIVLKELLQHKRNPQHCHRTKETKTQNLNRLKEWIQITTINKASSY